MGRAFGWSYDDLVMQMVDEALTRSAEPDRRGSPRQRGVRRVSGTSRRRPPPPPLRGRPRPHRGDHPCGPGSSGRRVHRRPRGLRWRGRRPARLHRPGATVDERLAGWICWGPTPCTLGTYDLYWMAVDPAARQLGSAPPPAGNGRPAGRSRAAHRRETAGRPDYRPTRAFYQARGYRKAAIIPDFYAPGDDQVVYVKR